MKIKHFLYNTFLIENGKTKIAIDPGAFGKMYGFACQVHARVKS